MKPEDFIRPAISAAIILLFGIAYVRDPDDQMMKGALIGALSTVVGYWLGSSKGSADAGKRADNAVDLARAVTDNAVVPQSVTVVNPASDPVQTEETRP